MGIICSLIFLLLEIFLEVSASYSVSGLYRGVWYQPIEHYALLGQSFMNISGISAVMCSAQCLSHRGCFSFNYDRINQVCQMNNATAEQPCDNFQDMRYFSYYDATANPTNCQNNIVYVDDKLKACSISKKLGLEDGLIPDENLSSSSNWEGVNDATSTPDCGRLNKIPSDSRIMGAWHPLVADTNQWIQVDLGKPTYVTGVLTQGRHERSYQWVKKYKVQFEPPSPACILDVKDQVGETQIFIGNINNEGIVERRFFKPVMAVKIRIVPVEWSYWITLRFELLGCK